MKKLIFFLIVSTSVYSQQYNNVISFDEVLSDVKEYIDLVKSPYKIEENAKRLGLSITNIDKRNGIPTSVLLKPIGSEDNYGNLRIIYYWGDQTSSPNSISFEVFEEDDFILKGTKYKAVDLDFNIESDGNISSFLYKPFGEDFEAWKYKLRTTKTEKLDSDGDTISEFTFVTNDTISLSQLALINGKYKIFRDVDMSAYTATVHTPDGNIDYDKDPVFLDYSYKVNYYDLENSNNKKIKTEYWVSKFSFLEKIGIYPRYGKKGAFDSFNGYVETLEKNTSFIDNVTLYLWERNESKYNKVDDDYLTKSYLQYIPQYKVYDYSENEFFYETSTRRGKKVTSKRIFTNPILERDETTGDTLFYLNSKDFKKILNDGMIKRYSTINIDDKKVKYVRKETIYKNGYLFQVNYYRTAGGGRFSSANEPDEDNYRTYLYKTEYFDTSSTKNKMTVNNLYRGEYEWGYDAIKTVKNYKSGYISEISVGGSNERFDDGFKLNDNFITQKLVLEINQNNKEEESVDNETKIVETSENNQTKIDETSEKEKNTEERQRYQKMLMEYNEVLEKDPNNGNAYYNIGLVHYYLGNISESKKNVQKAIDLESNVKEYYSTLLGIILGDDTKILEEMNSLGNSLADNRRYEELKEKRDLMLKESIPIWKSLIDIDESNLEALKGLQNIYSILGDSRGFSEINEILKKY